MPTIESAPKAVSFDGDPIYVDIKTDRIVDGVASEDNLSCYVAIKEEKGQGTNNNPTIAEINPPYYLPTGIADFDVSKILELTPSPPRQTIGNSSQDEPSMFISYYFIFTDIFGTPPEIHNVLPYTDPFICIAGQTRYMNGLYSTLVTSAPYILHSWIDEEANIFFKEVRKDQKEYIYFYTNEACTDSLTVTFHYSDGTTESTELKAVSTQAKTVNSIEVGYDRLELDDEKDSNKELAYYTLHIGVSSKLYYVVDEILNDNDQYFMYFNGCGGMEVFRASGFTAQNINVESKTYENVRWKGSNFQDGFIRSYGHKGRKELTINSGYYSKAYCQHLQQLLFNDIWHIDEQRNKYVLFNVLSSSMKVYDDLNDLYYVEITAAPAFYKNTFTNFKI